MRFRSHSKDSYLGLIKENGFENIKVQKEKVIVIPDDILTKYLTEGQLEDFKNSKMGIFSVTVYAEKPKGEADCGPNCCC